MSRIERYADLVSLLLVLGGLMALGAFAGTRVAFGLTTQSLNCGLPAFGGVDCTPLLHRLIQVGQTFALGGVVAMACGGIALWALGRGKGQQAEGEESHA